MKKKGLIISTVVMAVVLIASLTTATYAWFSTTSASTVSSIAISAAAGADVILGLKTDNTYSSGATQDSFQTGTCEFTKHATNNDKGSWNGTQGMSGQLETGLQLSAVAMATGQGKAAVPGDPITPGTASKLIANSAPYATAIAEGNSVIKASAANSAGLPDLTTVELATINADYLHFTLGVATTKDNIASIALNMFINPTDTKTTMGISTALHFAYSIDGGAYTDLDVYDVHYSVPKSDDSVNGASTIGDELSISDDTPLAAGWEKVTVTISPNADGAFVKNTEIHQIEFYVYYDGEDSDCVTAALGSSSQILFVVTNTPKA